MIFAGAERAESGQGADPRAAESEVAHFRAQVAGLAAKLKPLSGDALDGLWSGIDRLPDASLARALEAAEGIRQVVEPAPARRAGLPLAGLVAAFGLGVAAGLLIGRRTR